MTKNRNTSLKTALCLSLLGTAATQAAWNWDGLSITGDAPNTGSSSLDFSITPTHGGSDTGNAVDSLWFDQTPQPVDFAVTSTGGDVSWNFDSAVGAIVVPGVLEWYTYIEIELDPDNNGIIEPTVVTFDVTFPIGVTERNDNNGGIGFIPTASFLGTYDAELSVTDATGTPIVLDATSPFLFDPDSYSGGNAVWDDGNNWTGLHDTPTDTTDFNFPTSAGAVDPTQQIGSMTYTLSDFNLSPTGSTIIRFSMDGGVSSFAEEVVIPEPTSLVLLSLGGLGFLARRKRS